MMYVWLVSLLKIQSYPVIVLHKKDSNITYLDISLPQHTPRESDFKRFNIYLLSTKAYCPANADAFLVQRFVGRV